MTARDDLAVSALARALVRTGMYVDAGIDTSAGLDKPQVYAAAILNDPDMAADGLHFVMVETLERAALAATGDSGGPLDVERLARAMDAADPPVDGGDHEDEDHAEHLAYAKDIAAEYARLSSKEAKP